MSEKWSLYSVTDCPPEDRAEEEGYEWFAVWAMSEDDAIRYVSDENSPVMYVTGKLEGRDELHNPAKGMYLDNRSRVLRELGWCEPGELPCENCDKHSMGMAEFDVCDDCCYCRACAIDDAKHDCDTCHEYLTPKENEQCAAVKPQT